MVISILTVLNPDAVEGLPDLTTQVEYLASAVEGALSQELEPELIFCLAMTLPGEQCVPWWICLIASWIS